MEYFESFSCSIQSDELASIRGEGWIEQLIQMENINRLLLEEEKEEK